MNKSLAHRLAGYSGVRASIWVLYAIGSYIASTYVASFILFVVTQLGGTWVETTVAGSMFVRVLVYAIFVAFLVGGLKFAGLARSQIVKIIGLVRHLDWRDIGLAIVGFIGYGLLAAIVLTIASHVPGYNSGQAQDIGVTHIYGADRIVSFAVLVLVAPFFEEVLFRGLLYGYLRKLGIFRWAAVLAVGILFGLAHGQWNVGLDVFCLSIILCILRELTGSIWAGIIVHIIKNFIAFCLVYLVAKG